MAAELVYGLVFYRWLLRTGPISHQYVDALVSMTLRALTRLVNAAGPGVGWQPIA